MIKILNTALALAAVGSLGFAGTNGSDWTGLDKDMSLVSAESHMKGGPSMGALIRSSLSFSSDDAFTIGGEDLQGVFFYALFPNTLLSLHPDYVMFHTLWPQAPGQTQVTCEWLFHPAAFDQPGFDPDDAVAFWDRTNQQDWRICERVQHGIRSRVYTPGPASPSREVLLPAFHREVLRALVPGSTQPP